MADPSAPEHEDDYDEEEEEEGDEYGDDDATGEEQVAENSTTGELEGTNNNDNEERSLSVVNEENELDEVEEAASDKAVEENNDELGDGDEEEEEEEGSDNDGNAVYEDNQVEADYLAMESETEANLTDGEDEEISKVFTESADENNLKFDRTATIEEEDEHEQNEEFDDEEEEEEEEEEYEEVTDYDEEGEENAEMEEQNDTGNLNEINSGVVTNDNDNLNDNAAVKVAVEESDVNNELQNEGDETENPSETLERTNSTEDNGEDHNDEEQQVENSNVENVQQQQQQADEDNGSDNNSQHNRNQRARTASSRRVRFRVDGNVDANNSSSNNNNQSDAGKSERDAIATQLTDSSSSTFASLENGSNETDYDGEQWENGEDGGDDEKSSDEAYSTEENEAGGTGGAAGQSSTSRLSSARRVRSATNSAASSSARHHGSYGNDPGTAVPSENSGRLLLRRVADGWKSLRSPRSGTGSRTSSAASQLTVDVDGRTQNYLEQVRERMQLAADTLTLNSNISNNNGDAQNDDGRGSGIGVGSKSEELLRNLQADLENSLTVIKVTAQSASGFRSTLRQLYEALDGASASVMSPVENATHSSPVGDDDKVKVSDVSDEEQRLREAEKRAHMLRLVMDIKKLQLMAAEAETTVRQLEETAALVRNSGNRVRSAIQTRQELNAEKQREETERSTSKLEKSMSNMSSSGDSETSINKAGTVDKSGGSTAESSSRTVAAGEGSLVSTHTEETVPTDPLQAYYSQDHSFWPAYFYETAPSAASSSGHDASSSSSLMCVLRVDMEDFYTDMLTCTTVTLAPDDHVTSDETEQCASRLVELSSATGYSINFKPPAWLALPLETSHTPQHHELVVKTRCARDTESDTGWMERATVNIQFDMFKGTRFVELPIEGVKCHQFVVVCRPRADRQVFSSKGGHLTSSVDARISVAVAKPVFRLPSTVELLVFPLALQKGSKAGDKIVATSPLITIRCSKKPSEALILHAGAPGGPLVKPRPVTSMPRLQAQPKPSIITPLPLSPRSSPSPLAKSPVPVKTTRPATSLPRVQPSNEMVKEERLELMMKVDNKWVHATYRMIIEKENLTIRFDDEFTRFIILRTSGELSAGELNAAASCLEQSLTHHVTNIMVRLHSTHAQRIAIGCFKSDAINDAVDSLVHKGFKAGPPMSEEIMLKEGDVITVKFRGNVTMRQQADSVSSSSSSSCRMTFYALLKPAFVFGAVDAVDRFAQHSLDHYRGYAEFYRLVPETGEEIKLCEMILCIPKPPKEPLHVQRVAPKLDEGGAMTLEYFDHVGKGLADDWPMLVDRLGITHPRVQGILQKNRLTEPSPASAASPSSLYPSSDRDSSIVVDILLQWFKATTKASDKVAELYWAFKDINRQDLADDLYYRNYGYYATALVREQELKVQSILRTVVQYPSAVRKWRDIADVIGLGQSEIGDIEESHPGQPMHQLHLALLRALHAYSDNYEAYVGQLGKALRRVHAYDVAKRIESFRKMAFTRRSSESLQSRAARDVMEGRHVHA